MRRFHPGVSVALLLVLALPGRGAFAQEETPPPPVVQGIVLNFKDAALDAVLTYLSEAAGLTVVRETAVEGRVTILSRQPLNLEDAVTLLNSVLKEKGYAAIRMGKVLKIVTLAEAQRRNIPVRAGSDPTGITPSDEVITQIIPLRTIDAVKLKQDIAPLIPATANLTSNAAGNALILTDVAANVRRIAEIVRALDSQTALSSEVKVFTLKYANATSAAKLITEVFKDDTASQQPQSGFFGRGRFVNMMGAPPAQTNADDTARRAPRVTATADDRTNTVVVTGPADTLRLADSILKELDANPAEDQGIMVYPMRNGQAKKLETILNNLFGASQQARTGTAAGTTGGQRFGQQGTAGATGATAATTRQAAAGLLGQVYVVADQDTNSLMVMTAPKNFDQVRQILKDLDRPVPQVLIKVLLAEVTHDNSLDLGAEFSVLNLRAGGTKGSQLFTDLGVGSTGGMVFKLMETDFTATLRALEKIGKLDVLSRPYILASDNQLATITVGSSVPFITDTRTTETAQTINTIRYQDIGIILKVTPHINPDGLVILDVSPEITALTGDTVPISEKVNAPVFAKRSATSRVGILDGQTIVIGGLIEDRKTDTLQKVPLLGSIPLIGRLFQHKLTQKSKTELLIFLTPQVAKGAEALGDISAHEQSASKLAPEAVEPGAFQEHLKSMEKAPPSSPK